MSFSNGYLISETNETLSDNKKIPSCLRGRGAGVVLKLDYLNL
jgi:hypothetical protein